MPLVKRGMLISFGLFWLMGFVLIAPAPLYRFFYAQANDVLLESPVEVFESLDWSHPYYYQDIGRAFRTLAQQANTDDIVVYFDPTSAINTDRHIRYFREYMRVWAYPRVPTIVDTLADIDSGVTVMISTDATPLLDNCTLHEMTLYLCQS